MVNQFINALVAFLIGGATLSFNFKAVDASGKVMYNGNGTVLVMDDSYRMETPDLLIVSDGEVKGIYQKNIDEIVLQSVAAGNGSSVSDASLQVIMDNPMAILRHAGELYSTTTWKDGKKATSGAPGALPDRVDLCASSGAVYTIEILSAKKLDSVDKSAFVLDTDDYPSAVVTDLR